MPQAMGKTLVVTALTADAALLDRLLASPLVDRLNVGAIPTNQISWDQPHEGNLFEHLYARRRSRRPSLSRRTPGPRSREDPVDHRRRRQHVLRQLPARQRARRRAAGARATTSCCCRSTRRRAPTNGTSARGACCSAASASTSSSTRRSSATRRASLDRLLDAEWVIRMASKRQIRSIRRASAS